MFVKFLVVKDLMAYNIILDRPTLNTAKAVVATHLLMTKFECNDGSVGSLQGDQQSARECYLTTLKPSGWKAEEPDEKRRKVEVNTKPEVMAIHSLSQASRPVREFRKTSYLKKKGHKELLRSAAT